MGKEWLDSWHRGLPNAYQSNYQTHLTGIVWTYNLVKAWGLLDFAKDRYGCMENNLKKWSAEKTKDENMKSMGAGFGWTPGTAIDPKLDYTQDFANCPEQNKERLMEAIQFIPEWASKKKEGEDKKTVPMEWEVAYDMRPWAAFPER